MLEPLNKRQHIALVALTILVGATRLYPLSQGPWDWDEILFCLAIDNYDVALHQPHPAGFPLFIFLGKIARLFVSTDFHALQAVNVLASMAVFPVMYWVARAFRLDFLASVGAALLFAFLPNVWFYGGTAFSDPLGMVLFLGAIAAYLTAGLDTRRYVIASIWLATAILVRPQNLFVAIFPWTLATVRLVRAKQWRALIAGTVTVVLLVGIGYGGAALATGVESYVNALRGHSHYVARADSIASQDRPPMLEVFRLQLNPFDSAKVALVMNVLALLAIVFGRRDVRNAVLLTYLPFMLFSAFAANPLGASRFSLNYLAGVVILVVEGIDVLARWVSRGLAKWTSRGSVDARVPIRAVVLLALMGRLIVWAIPAFAVPRTTDAPPTAAAQWLNRNVPMNRVLFVDHSMWPWMRYYAPRHQQQMVFSPEQVLTHPRAVNAWYVALAPPPDDGAIAFRRPRNRTWNIVTKRAFEAFVQPTAEVVGFAYGWFALEEDGVSSWRWSGPRAYLLLGPDDGPRELRLKFFAPAYVSGKPVRVTFTFNDQVLGTVDAKEETDVRYVVRGRSDSVNLLRVDIHDTFIPAQDGKSTDHRELGIMLRSCTWRRAS